VENEKGIVASREFKLAASVQELEFVTFTSPTSHSLCISVIDNTGALRWLERKCGTARQDKQAAKLKKDRIAWAGDLLVAACEH
jgi:hypothetical protein